MVADARGLDDMADIERSALGLSLGATNLAAATAERAVTRKAVLTLYRQRPAEVGVPSENPKLDEPGLVISDFVHRVGHPDAIVASDGTLYRSETLVADALRALAYTVTAGRHCRIRSRSPTPRTGDRRPSIRCGSRWVGYRNGRMGK